MLFRALGVVVAPLLEGHLHSPAVFDAGDSLASGLYNMYGPNHLQIDKRFLKACEGRLGYSRSRLLLYRALYTLAASNAYSEDGSDGQYAWCVAALQREDVRDTLAQEVID